MLKVDRNLVESLLPILETSCTYVDEDDNELDFKDISEHLDWLEAPSYYFVNENVNDLYRLASHYKVNILVEDDDRFCFLIGEEDYIQGLITEFELGEYKAFIYKDSRIIDKYIVREVLDGERYLIGEYLIDGAQNLESAVEIFLERAFEEISYDYIKFERVGSLKIIR